METLLLELLIQSDWLDINGDGLPDMLLGDKVKFGLGYNFTNEESSGVTSLESSENSTWGAGLGTSIGVLGNADISFGVNGTKTTTKYNVSFIDINGDGLPDMVTRSGGKFTIMLNTGSGLFLIPKNNKVVSMSHWQRPFLNMVILLFPFQYIFCF